MNTDAIGGAGGGRSFQKLFSDYLDFRGRIKTGSFTENEDRCKVLQI